MIKIIILIIVSILYFVAFPLLTSFISIPYPYEILSNVAFFMYIIFWIIPIIYLWIRKKLSSRNIYITILVNIILVIFFFIFANTPYGIEIRTIRQNKTIERARMREEFQKTQESSWGIYINR